VRLNPERPAALEHIINKALEKDRKLRYQNASDMRTDLVGLKRDSDLGRSAAVSGGARTGGDCRGGSRTAPTTVAQAGNRPRRASHAEIQQAVVRACAQFLHDFTRLGAANQKQLEAKLRDYVCALLQMLRPLIALSDASRLPVGLSHAQVSIPSPFRVPSCHRAEPATARYRWGDSDHG
jgi:hypothetical protein